MAIKTIGVVGAGTMGTGIAHLAAMSGYDVILRDVDIAYVERSVANMDKLMSRSVKKGKLTEEARQTTLARIKKTSIIEDLEPADFIIEAVLEQLELKKEIFQTLHQVCRPGVIFATNTSSMSITEIAAASGRPDKVCGMHFFNPAQVMHLVEIISGIRSADETITITTELAQSLGKVTVHVKKDSPGFIVNRIMIPQMIEAARLLQEGVATVEDIDKAVKFGLNYPMGPFELLDFGGIDVAYFVMEYLADELRNNQYAAPQVIKQMVRAGKLGRKSSEGFFAYQ